jgi:molybdopterin synthase sulfur carrier subunit
MARRFCVAKKPPRHESQVLGGLTRACHFSGSKQFSAIDVDQQRTKEKNSRMATVYVPTPLRRLTGGQAKVEVVGEDIGTIIQTIDAQYPGVADRLLDDDGNIKRFINVFVNDSEIRGLQGMHTPVNESDKVSIVPAMAGGQG